MEDPYFVSLGLRECGKAGSCAVTDSVTGELVDHYELTHPGGGTCVVAVWREALLPGGQTYHPHRGFWTTLPAEPASTVSAAAGARPVPLRLGVRGVLREGVVHDALSRYRL